LIRIAERRGRFEEASGGNMVMHSSIARAGARAVDHASRSDRDPFLTAFEKYNATLMLLFQAQKRYENETEAPEVERITDIWITQLDRLVRITPTTWAGVKTLINVSLDPESVGPDRLLLAAAMRSVDRALKQLVQHKPAKINRRTRQLRMI
jgi:hypothetical protein